MAAAKGKTNWFAVGVSIAVVVVLVALGGLVVFLNNQATAPATAPQSALMDKETGALTFGSGEDTVDTFVDFICPACGSFEEAYGQTLQEAAANDEITLNVYPISILDHYSLGDSKYSSRAAGAMYCVAAEEPDVALDYFNLLFEKRPEEGTAGLSDAELTALAEQVGGGSAAECIADGTYMEFARELAKKNNIRSTPTVQVNGERLENADIPAAFAKLFS